MIQPTQDRILVKIIQNSEMSEGGIYKGQATTTFRQDRDKAIQQTVGEVIAKGLGKYNKKGQRRAPDVNIGDTVHFSDTAGRFIDDEHMMVKEASISFIIEGLTAGVDMPVIYEDTTSEQIKLG